MKELMEQRIKLTPYCNKVHDMYKKTLIAFALSVCFSTAFAADSTSTSPLVSHGSKECETVITSQVATGLLDKIIKAVPKNKNDNVYEAIKQSKAQQINKQKIPNINTDVSVSIYSKAESVWTKALDKAIETAKGAVDTLITSVFNNAVDKAMSTVNNATNKALGKVASKFGGQAGNILYSSLGHIIPNATSVLGGCVKDLNVECLSRVQDAIDASISQGISSGISGVQNAAYSTALDKVSNVYSGTLGRIGGINSHLGEWATSATNQAYYQTRSTIQNAIYSYDSRTAAAALSDLGSDSLIQLYGK